MEDDDDRHGGETPRVVLVQTSCREREGGRGVIIISMYTLPQAN